MYGLTEEDITIMHKIFSQTGNIEKVILYGSRAKGTNKPFSDVDITLIGNNLTQEDLTEVSEKLSDSSLPYYFDISLYYNISNTNLMSHIQRMGKIIYKK